jgi:hypothetical protein
MCTRPGTTCSTFGKVWGEVRREGVVWWVMKQQQQISRMPNAVASAMRQLIPASSSLTFTVLNLTTKKYCVIHYF